MKREQSVVSDTSVPDPLNIFAKKIGEIESIHGEQGKFTAKELLTILMPVQKPKDCLPTISSFEKCNKLNDGIRSTFGHFTRSNYNRKVDETFKKVFDNIEEEVEEDVDSETRCSCSLTEELELSFDGKWLKKYFELPLRMAIKEIISRKPYDPIGYLGFWLLNYRRCQELVQLKLEDDNRLNYYRSLIEQPMSKEEEVSLGGGEEEEEMRDLNFKHYETAHMSK